MQTLASRLAPLPDDIPSAASERLRFAMDDGSGDVLLGMLDWPVVDGGGPALILIHGLTGSQDSLYMRRTARHFVARGHPVLRLNLRAAGPSRATCGDIYYSGRTGDFRRVLAALPGDLADRALVGIGYSLGGNMLLKYMGEEGERAWLAAAATVCAPIDLSVTCAHMMKPRNRLYHKHIIAEMKREALAPEARLTAAERAAIAGSRTVWDYDDRFIAPRHGFAGAEDYYDKNMALRFLPGIRKPTLTIAASDDPWIPAALYERARALGNDALCVKVTRGGGHVGFRSAGDDVAWHDRAIERLLAGVR